MAFRYSRAMTTIEREQDMELLLQSATLGAKERGLLVLDAAYAGDPDVILVAEKVSLDQVLDLAAVTQAPFVSIQTTLFSFEELVAESEDEDGELPHDLAPHIEALREYDGEMSSVSLRWIANGTDYLFIATTEWEDLATEIGETAEVIERASRFEFVSTRFQRRREIAVAVEAVPEVRAIGKMGRKAVVSQHIRAFLQPSDDIDIELGATRDAVQLATENSLIAYSDVESRLQDLANELVSTDGWKSAGRRADRVEAARQHLISVTGGYGPVMTLATRLQGLAEDVERAALGTWAPNTRGTRS